METPSIKECFELIEKMDMMSHIIDHSIMVANVAFFLCQQLKIKFPELNCDLAVSAALLHDITKTRSFDTKELHAQTGGELLTGLGYQKAGDIIRQHVILDLYDNRWNSHETDSFVSEQEIVNYSDKRVLHDTVVLLKKRLEYIKKKYGNQQGFKNRIKIVWDNTINLEKKLFSHLDISPEQLSQNIEKKIKRPDTYNVKT
ncbi:MAG: HDIG domain-containing protein [Desulfobacula sp.]|nr:HDIG domain-containing protein [Desulfobacula sp.]